MEIKCTLKRDGMIEEFNLECLRIGGENSAAQIQRGTDSDDEYDAYSELDEMPDNSLIIDFGDNETLADFIQFVAHTCGKEVIPRNGDIFMD